MQIYPNGIELIACYEQRDAMKKVATGMQNGADIMNLFGSSRKKKDFPVATNSRFVEAYVLIT